MRVGILAYDSCLASGVHGFSDTLAVVNLIMEREVFETVVLSVDGGPVRCFAGAVVRADEAISDAAPGERRWDIVYVPPAFGLTEPDRC